VTDRGEIIWTPAEGAFAASRMGAFASFATGRGAPAMHDYPMLLQWSLDQPGTFWATFAEWSGVHWHRAPSTALEGALPSPRWFADGTLNYAEHALAHAATPGALASTAIVALSQTRARIELTWAELAEQTTRCRAGLARLGVGTGDRVAAFLPNVPETLVLMLAAASLGAIFTSCAPEFGTRAVIDRWSQLEPSVVVAIDGYRYGTRDIDRRSDVSHIVEALPSVRHLVWLPYLFDAAESGAPEPEAPTRLSWNDLCAPTDLAWSVLPVPFNHPLYVLFSSGTTGLPKPIVHGHGGITLEHLKLLSLHHDLGPGARLMWFTTTGWMMWNYLVSGMLVGATVVMFDGDPGFPDLSALWRIAADEQLDVFGVSAPFIMACRKAGLEPGAIADLRSLRQLGSTGAPLPREGFRWIRDHVGAQVQPCSLSGGTDVCTAFVGSAPSVAVRAGEISVRMLGCDVRAASDDGLDLPAGETGELIIATPMPSMPVGLWNDPSGDRYRATYFETFPGRWHHGDWITFHDDGACEITGRSDATLNRGGVRLGTSDFYAVVDAMPEVLDSVVVHLEDPAGGSGELILLISCRPGIELDDELRRSISSRLRTELSPRHVPDVIDVVAAIPRTLSGKKLEVPIKRMLLGRRAEEVASRGSLADPTALDGVQAWADAHRSRDQP
jgi:acetoacetyl-CoA synthetase